jgi:hypothetical protein
MFTVVVCRRYATSIDHSARFASVPALLLPLESGSTVTRFKRGQCSPASAGMMGRLWNPEIRDRIKRLHQQMREAS